MVSRKVVTPLKNGVQVSCNSLKILDSGSEAGMKKNGPFGFFAVKIKPPHPCPLPHRLERGLFSWLKAMNNRS
jgi:hypothetical protein